MNLFGSIDINSIIRKPEASSNLFSGLLQAWGMGNQQKNWEKANLLPKPRPDPKPPEPKPSPEPPSNTGPDITGTVPTLSGKAADVQPAWMTSGSPFAYDTMTGKMGPDVVPSSQVMLPSTSTGDFGGPDFSWNVSPSRLPAEAPVIQDAPAYGFKEPANWDGSPRGTWLTAQPAQSFRAKDDAQLGQFLLEAQSLAPEEALNRVAQIRSANSDWLVSKPIQKMFTDTKENIINADRFQHREKTEFNAMQAQKLRLAAETGTLDEIKQYGEMLQAARLNATKEETTQLDEATDIQKNPGREVMPGVMAPNAQSKYVVANVRQAQIERKAQETNARNIKMAQDADPALRTTVSTDPKTGEPRVSATRPSPSVASQTPKMPKDIEDQRTDIASKKRLLESELGQLKRSMVDSTDKKKKAKEPQVLELEKQISELSKRRIFLGTNWNKNATALMGTNAPVVNPTGLDPVDPLGKFNK